MKYCTSLFCLFVAAIFMIGSATAQQVPVTKANYALAARFSPKKVDKLIFSTSVDPHFLKKSERFWYMYETTEGKKWYIVDPVKAEKKVLFDIHSFPTRRSSDHRKSVV